MQNNLIQPLNPSYTDVMIGQSGPLNWFFGANCQKNKVQFSDSLWRQQKIMIKQKIQNDLIQTRMALALWRDANKMNKISLSLSIAMFGALLVYIFAINSYSYSQNYSFASYLAIIFSLVMLILTFSAIVFVCVYVRKVNDKVSTAIGFLNQKLRNQGLNIYLVTKKKCPFPTLLNIDTFEIYQRIIY